MTETQSSQIKVQIDANGIHYESSGMSDEVIPRILQFLSEAIPTYDLARRLIYVPNLAELADCVSDFAKMTNTGQLLLMRNDLTAERSILIVLFMSHLATKIGKRAVDSLSIDEIANGAGKASKTIRNTIAKMQRTGLIERTDLGGFRITQKGLMELECSLNDAVAKEKRTELENELL